MKFLVYTLLLQLIIGIRLVLKQHLSILIYALSTIIVSLASLSSVNLSMILIL